MQMAIHIILSLQRQVRIKTKCEIFNLPRATVSHSQTTKKVCLSSIVFFVMPIFNIFLCSWLGLAWYTDFTWRGFWWKLVAGNFRKSGILWSNFDQQKWPKTLIKWSKIDGNTLKFNLRMAFYSFTGVKGVTTGPKNSLEISTTTPLTPLSSFYSKSNFDHCVRKRKIQVIRKFPLQKTHISSVMIMRNVQFAEANFFSYQKKQTVLRAWSLVVQFLMK